MPDEFTLPPHTCPKCHNTSPLNEFQLPGDDDCRKSNEKLLCPVCFELVKPQPAEEADATLF